MKKNIGNFSGNTCWMSATCRGDEQEGWCYVVVFLENVSGIGVETRGSAARQPDRVARFLLIRAVRGTSAANCVRRLLFHQRLLLVVRHWRQCRELRLQGNCTTS
jgi:hypothetical protein